MLVLIHHGDAVNSDITCKVASNVEMKRNGYHSCEAKKSPVPVVTRIPGGGLVGTQGDRILAAPPYRGVGPHGG
jgi:hypothetical protein